MQQHIPVLYQAVLDLLNPVSGGLYVDGTLGAGGHTRGILIASSPDGKVAGFDRDPQALVMAKQNLTEFGERVIFIKDTYQHVQLHLNNLNWQGVDGILIDLGLSSMQLDTPERGFSFREDGPLDMRFDPDQALTAADLVNESTREELADLIFTYGEEKQARKIADAIIANRPLVGTKDLAKIVKKVARNPKSKIHPATRTFQALRIVVNQELDALQAFLPKALDSLNTGGRLAIIAFHSLEDRIVKQFFRMESRDCVCPPEVPICVCEHQARIKELNRRPIRPEESELIQNPRARSARLRVAEKIF
jgi:16S rRNA (cytosine1402-N4)-methyltransferase